MSEQTVTNGTTRPEAEVPGLQETHPKPAQPASEHAASQPAASIEVKSAEAKGVLQEEPFSWLLVSHLQ